MSALAAASAGLSRVAYLADDTDIGDETHKAGPIAIVVIIVLCVACFILFRSMTKHLRRVREDFPEASAPAPDADDSPEDESFDVVAPAPSTAPKRPAPKSRAHASEE